MLLWTSTTKRKRIRRKNAQIKAENEAIAKRNAEKKAKYEKELAEHNRTKQEYEKIKIKKAIRKTQSKNI